MAEELTLLWDCRPRSPCSAPTDGEAAPDVDAAETLEVGDDAEVVGEDVGDADTDVTPVVYTGDCVGGRCEVTSVEQRRQCPELRDTEGEPCPLGESEGECRDGVCELRNLGGCTDTCVFAFDSECDDGGPDATGRLCQLGTDCSDCGPR